MVLPIYFSAEIVNWILLARLLLAWYWLSKKMREVLSCSTLMRIIITSRKCNFSNTRIMVQAQLLLIVWSLACGRRLLLTTGQDCGNPASLVLKDCKIHLERQSIPPESHVCGATSDKGGIDWLKRWDFQSSKTKLAGLSYHSYEFKKSEFTFKNCWWSSNNLESCSLLPKFDAVFRFCRFCV
jgi:hypothetical protein